MIAEIVAPLIRHFGHDRVQAALDRHRENEGADGSGSRPRRQRKGTSPGGPTITLALQRLRAEDEEKYQLLNSFYSRLQNKEVLPEAQDIRHFAQALGLKEIKGKSRKDMGASLMRFLLGLPANRLRSELEAAATISEAERRKGFSVITEKLLGEPNPERE